MPYQEQITLFPPRDVGPFDDATGQWDSSMKSFFTSVCLVIVGVGIASAFRFGGVELPVLSLTADDDRTEKLRSTVGITDPVESGTASPNFGFGQQFHGEEFGSSDRTIDDLLRDIPPEEIDSAEKLPAATWRTAALDRATKERTDRRAYPVDPARPPVTPRLLGLYQLPSDSPSEQDRLPVPPLATNFASAWLLVEYPQPTPQTHEIRDGDRLAVIRNGQRLRNLAVKRIADRQWVQVDLIDVDREFDPESSAGDVEQVWQVRAIRSNTGERPHRLLESERSNPVVVQRDTSGPRFDSVSHFVRNERIDEITLHFADDDLDPTTFGLDAVRIDWLDNRSRSLAQVNPIGADVEADRILLRVPTLRAGRYRVELAINPDAERVLTDRTGNPATGDTHEFHRPSSPSDSARPRFDLSETPDRTGPQNPASSHAKQPPLSGRVVIGANTGQASQPSGDMVRELIELQWRRDANRLVRLLSGKASTGAFPPDGLLETVADRSALDRVQLSAAEPGLIHVHGPRSDVRSVTKLIRRFDRPVGSVRLNLTAFRLSGPSGTPVQIALAEVERALEGTRLSTERAVGYFLQAVGESAAGSDPLTFFDPAVLAALREANPVFADSLLNTGVAERIDSVSRAVLLLALARPELRLAALERFKLLLAGATAIAPSRIRLANGTCSDDGVCQTASHMATCDVFPSFMNQWAVLGHSPHGLTPIQREIIELARSLRDRSQNQNRIAAVSRELDNSTETLIDERSRERQLQSVRDRIEQVRAETAREISLTLQAGRRTERRVRGALTALHRLGQGLDATDDASADRLLAAFADDSRRKVLDDLLGLRTVDAPMQSDARAADLVKTEAGWKLLPNKPIEITEVSIEMPIPVGQRSVRLIIPRGELGLRVADARIVGAALIWSDTKLTREIALWQQVGRSLRWSPSEREAITDLTDILSRMRDRLPGEEPELITLASQAREQRFRLRRRFSEMLGELDRAVENWSRLPTETPKDWMTRGQVLADLLLVWQQRSVDGPVLADLNDVLRKAEMVQAAWSRLAELERAETLLTEPASRRALLRATLEAERNRSGQLAAAARARSAAVDGSLRTFLSAFEDDCRVTFLSPAINRIRASVDETDVSVDAVERYSVLAPSHGSARIDPELGWCPTACGQCGVTGDCMETIGNSSQLLSHQGTQATVTPVLLPDGRTIRATIEVGSGVDLSTDHPRPAREKLLRSEITGRTYIPQILARYQLEGPKRRMKTGFLKKRMVEWSHPHVIVIQPVAFPVVAELLWPHWIAGKTVCDREPFCRIESAAHASEVQLIGPPNQAVESPQPTEMQHSPPIPPSPMVIDESPMPPRSDRKLPGLIEPIPEPFVPTPTESEIPPAPPASPMLPPTPTRNRTQTPISFRVEAEPERIALPESRPILRPNAIPERQWDQFPAAPSAPKTHHRVVPPTHDLTELPAPTTATNSGVQDSTSGAGLVIRPAPARNPIRMVGQAIKAPIRLPGLITVPGSELGSEEIEAIRAELKSRSATRPKP